MNLKSIDTNLNSAPQMHLSLTENHIVDLTKKQSFTNTIITKKAGKLTYEILS